MYKQEIICTVCGTSGTAKKYTRGSILIELVLWLCFILPGLLYSLWRVSSKKNICKRCGSENIVPLNSPVGQDLLVRFGKKE